MRAKLNYVSKDFLSDINSAAWPGLVAQGDTNTNANTQKIVPFCFKTSRESFGHGGKDRRRRRPWQSPQRGSQRTNSHSKTDRHTEIKVFAIAGAQIANAHVVETSKVADSKRYRDTSRYAVAAKRNFARRRVVTDSSRKRLANSDADAVSNGNNDTGTNPDVDRNGHTNSNRIDIAGFSTDKD